MSRDVWHVEGLLLNIVGEEANVPANIDGDWTFHRKPLASLHANPWCSAMRRARILDDAARRMCDREMFDMPMWPREGAFEDAHWWHMRAFGAACSHEMESVR